MKKRNWKVLIILGTILLLASTAQAGTLNPSFTDFEEAGFAPSESVHNHMPDGNVASPEITFGNNCVQAWFVPGSTPKDEEIVDVSGSFPDHGKVWRFSNGINDGSLGQAPHSANSGAVHGESGAANDAGCGPPTTADYYAEFEFRSATGASQLGYSISVSANSGDTRHAFTRILDDDGEGFDIQFFDTVNGTSFRGTTLDLDLSYTDWHTLGIEIFFRDGLASGVPGDPGAEGNDVVNIYVDGILVHTGTTWESYVGARSVDRLLFDHATTNSAFLAGGLYIDNVLVTETCPEGHCLADNEGPITTNVAATPNPIAVNANGTVIANIDDSTTGGSDITSAEYSLDGGATWTNMNADDGDLDEVSEDVSANFTAPAEAGIYDLCVRGTDEHGNVGEAECVMLVVYDPDGGFVTGGGWIDSPEGAYLPAPGGVNVVTAADVNVSWFSPDLRGDGYVDFVAGPDSPPLGNGSLEMGSTASVDKAQLFNYDHVGTLLADINGLSYATYRDSSSTNSPSQYPTINMQVDYVGDGSGFTTLVWEPIYAYGQANLAVDSWQTWDTMVPSQTGFGGGWWSTSAIPGVCAFNCFVDWNTIVSNNPDAKIIGGFGVNIGSGWHGVFTGNVDALSLSINDDVTTYDFELDAPFDPTGKANFGFVAKYKKGANVPMGNTEFVFEAGGLNFHSSSYDWLLVTGNDTAKFKGEGSINGDNSPAGDPYKFQIWAQDAKPDTFRIKIWYEDNGSETVVYDNGTDQTLGGGNIVVHKK